jgi:hypothetical protein
MEGGHESRKRFQIRLACRQCRRLLLARQRIPLLLPQHGLVLLLQLLVDDGALVRLVAV